MRAGAGQRWVRGLFGAVLVGCTVLFLVISRHWPLVGDASLIHYLCFLMDQGMAPYRDTGDMNMPMAFLLEWAAMHSFGMGDGGWRLFDFFVLAVAAGAMAWIAGRRDWLAAVFAGSLFALVHGQDGFAQAGQRDLVLAVNLLVATAMLFSAVRGGRLWLMAGFGLFAGVACAVKPTVLPLVLVLAGLAVMALVRRGVRPWAYGAIALLTGLAAPGASLVFLLREHATRAFVDGLRTVVPFYMSLGHRPPGFLLLHSISPLLGLVVLWGGTVLLARPRWDWERTALAAGAMLGLAAYVVQARGFPYYRYPLLAFLLPLMGIDLCAAWKKSGQELSVRGGRALATAGLALGALWIAPTSVRAMSRFDPGSIDFIQSLQRDLETLGGPALAGEVQCIDSVSGCGTVLYRMRLVQATGVLSDFLLFGSSGANATGPQPAIVQRTRASFAEALRLHPPRVIVVTSWLHIDGPGEYQKLERWPEFAAYLSANYTVAEEWRPTRPERWWTRPVWSHGYRIYVRR